MNEPRRNDVTGVIGRIGERLMRFIRARVPSEADAEDISQDVWQKFVTAFDEGQIEEVGAWLYTVARNRIVDQYRKPRMASLDALAAETESADESFDLASLYLPDERTPETEYLKNLFWEQLHAALAELPPEQREVFVWHELEGLSFREIAALTGENLNTLLSRKRYAMQSLRQRLDSLHDEFLS